MNHAVVASDLDRTLIYSANAAGGPEAISQALVVEMYDGAPLSHVSVQAAADLAWLIEAQRLVPVTTRTVVQYQRISLVPQSQPQPKFAVCANGGRVLVDGADDLGYRSHLAAGLAACAPLAEVVEVFGRWCVAVAGETADGGPRRREAEGLFCYAVFDAAAPDQPLVDDLIALLVPLGWNVSAQGRKVYCMPNALTKEGALGYLADTYALEVRGAAGDSLLDAGMVRTFGGWVPRDSELERRGFSADGVAYTAGAGLAAGQEILAGFRALVSR